MPDPKKKKTEPVREPIYVSNPNHHWIKAYQDSLTTYNLAPEYNKKIASEYLKSNSTKEARDRIEQVDSEFEKKGFNRGLRLWRDYEKNPRWNRKVGFSIAELEYKKPVQPVLYMAERPKVDKASVKTKGASLSVKKKDLQPQKSLPKSIDSIKMDASGINVYLSLNGKQTVMPKKEFTSWLQNPENRAMYDKYRSSQAKTLKKK